MTNRLEIRITQCDPFAEGYAFGETGAYERLVGRVHFAVDHRAPAQAGVVDLEHAPRNTDGLVEFAADLCIVMWGNRCALHSTTVVPEKQRRIMHRTTIAGDGPVD